MAKDWIEDGYLEGKNHHDPKTWRSQVIRVNANLGLMEGYKKEQ